MVKALLAFSCLGFAFSNAWAAQTYRYLRLPASTVTKSFVDQSGFIEDHFHDGEYIIGYLPIQNEYLLSKAARDWAVELDPVAWAKQRFDIKTLQVMKERENTYLPYEDFHTYDTLTAELKALANRYPQLVTLATAGKTVEGRELWYMRVSALSVTTPNKPKLLYISSMHGDEVTGKEMLIYLIRDLLGRYGSDDRITALVDNADIFIMPSMNPDGTEKSQRFNADGVDLNRNFPELDEDPFGGNRAVETKNVLELHRQHHFLTAVNFHGGSLCINIPWDSKKNSGAGIFEDNALMQSMAQNYARLNKPMHDHHEASFNHGVTYGYEWYPVYGGMQDWASYFRQATHATVEISYSKWPSASNLPTHWADNREALLRYLEDGMTGIHLKVVDAQNKPVDVDVAIKSANRKLHYSGYVHRPTAPGIQEVTLSAPGYKDLVLRLEASLFDGSYQTLVMDKD